MAAVNKEEATKKAKDIVNKWSIGFASVAWIPGSHYVMAAGDLTMVMQVGSVFGVDLDRTAAATVFTSIAAPMIGSFVANSILDFIPVIGWIAKSGVSYGVTKGVGKALIAYFYDCSPLRE